jgi:mannose-6-phosphate isomerase-like protein (cupin superfamily)
VNAGDCIATKMGDHHDFPIVKEKIHGVYFETTLKGEKRLGHLWEKSLKKVE